MADLSSKSSLIAIIGGSRCQEKDCQLGYDLGYGLAQRNLTVINGGLKGMMEASAQGCREGGGSVIGILPGSDPLEGNPYLTHALATGMGHARNAIIAQSAAVIIALPGQSGTLSEIGLGLAMGKSVVSLLSWYIAGVNYVETVPAALAQVDSLLSP